jgi:hypothetical protein
MEAPIDCTRCRQFLVTWRPGTPRGCRLYGFEGVRLPSLVVLEATGEACQGFEPREPAERDGRRAPSSPRTG